MKKIYFEPATGFDFSLILDMQIKNHRSYLSKDEQANGFVTVLTPLDYLRRINNNKNIFIARYLDGENKGTPAGYLISVDEKACRGHAFLTEFYLQLYSYGIRNPLIIAQIGLQRNEVGKRSGIGKQIYTSFLENIVPTLPYKKVVTEVSSENPISIKFHVALGFKKYKCYEDNFGNQMIVMVKDINN